MRNEEFKQLVALLEADPDVLHDLMVGKAGKPELEGLLSGYERNFAANTPFQAKLLNGLFKDEVDRTELRDIVAACVDSCEASRLGAVDVGPLLSGGMLPDTPALGLDSLQSQAAGCDANSTCSCTSGTCGGVTCGGSTCSATCTGDSCGNTCGDSCGFTTNVTRPFDVEQRLMQFAHWR